MSKPIECGNCGENLSNKRISVRVTIIDKQLNDEETAYFCNTQCIMEDIVNFKMWQAAKELEKRLTNRKYSDAIIDKVIPKDNRPSK